MIRHLFLDSIGDYVLEKTHKVAKELDDLRTKLCEENDVFLPYFDEEYQDDFQRELEFWFNDNYSSNVAFANFSKEETAFLTSIYYYFDMDEFLEFDAIRKKYGKRALRHIKHAPEFFHIELYIDNKDFFNEKLDVNDTRNFPKMADLVEESFYPLHQKLYALFEDKVRELEKSLTEEAFLNVFKVS
ncbi:hypothetical protein [Campylobacter helveticus]|uniref:hypothetical protein n=1 Tax=Campylobacter helveticus TaxID=28898 RepID=UPI0022EA6530|nr:hypothetical protein [Campylobacter helveticus]